MTEYDLATAQEQAVLRVVDFVHRGTATSRADIARRTGLARSTVSQHIEHLMARGIVEEIGTEEGRRGRPARTLRIARTAGTVAVADLDGDATNLAIADLSGQLIARSRLPTSLHRDPEDALRDLESGWRSLLRTAQVDDIPLRQVVVGVPAPVDFRRGQAVRPPLMPGWDGYPIGKHLTLQLGAPAVIDNDVNLLALAEAARDPGLAPLVVIKVAYGIGAGIVTASGDVHRGADGAAGDIGHIKVATRDDAHCHCGRNGCLEAVASLDALARELELAVEATDPLAAIDALRSLMASGDASTLRAVRRASEALGEVAAGLVQMLNPRTLVLSGPLGTGQDEIVSGVRGVVYQRAVTLTTRELTVTTSQLGDDAGLRGGVELAMREVWRPEGIRRLLKS